MHPSEQWVQSVVVAVSFDAAPTLELRVALWRSSSLPVGASRPWVWWWRADSPQDLGDTGGHRQHR
jgi:hypothetical protein